MRALLLAALTLAVGACVSERLRVHPPAGVDLSGQWTLNEADSDDPQHLLNPQNRGQEPGNEPPAGRSRSRRGVPGPLPGGWQGPPPPGWSQMRTPLSFPGRQVEIRQVAGVVTFSSGGRSRVCQPGTQRRAQRRPDYRDRDPSPMAPDAASPLCGWEEATLVVMGEGDDERERVQFEEQYTLSADRQRLLETVVFKSGRSSGFTLSRVWDRASGPGP